jgi:hypothetical protein
MDPSWTVLCFTATPFIFGALRWTVWPDSMAGMQTAELVAWAGVYVLSIMSGLMSFWVVQSRGQVSDRAPFSDIHDSRSCHYSRGIPVDTAMLGTVPSWTLVGIGIMAFIKMRPLMARIKLDGDTSLRQDLLKRVEFLEEQRETDRKECVEGAGQAPPRKCGGDGQAPPAHPRAGEDHRRASAPADHVSDHGCRSTAAGAPFPGRSPT